MLRKKKDNSEYEIDRELTWKFAIEKNAEYQDRIAELEEENKKLKKECEENDYLVEDNARWMKKCEEKTMEIKKLKSDLAFERTMLDNVRAEYKSLQNVIKNLKERIDVLYEFIERNDKLVDEVIDEEDLDKLNRYIYIDDDLVDRTLESED